MTENAVEPGLARIGCVIMAAGRSQRFGGNKLLAPLAGRPVLGHVLGRIPPQAFVRRICVVSCREAEEICRDAGVPCLRYAGGAQSDTLRLGLSRMLDLDGCMFAMGDQPLLERESVLRLAQAFSRSPQDVCRLAFGDCAGSPVVFPKACFGALMALTGEHGGMYALRGRSERVRLVQAGYARELMDADTPQALSALEAALIQSR